MPTKTPIRMGKARRNVLRWIRKHGAGNKFLLPELINGIGLDPDNHRERTSTYNCLRGIRESILNQYMFYTLYEPELLKHIGDEEKFYNKVIDYLHSFGLYLIICDDNHYYFEPTFDDLSEYQNKRIKQEWKVFYNRVKRSVVLRAELPSGKHPKELIMATGDVEKEYLLPAVTKVTKSPQKVVKIKECPTCHRGLLISITDDEVACTDCFRKFKK